MRETGKLNKPVKTGTLHKPAPKGGEGPAPSHYVENQDKPLPPGPRTFQK